MTVLTLRSWLLCACIAAGALGGCSANGSDPPADVYVVPLGDKDVQIVVHESNADASGAARDGRQGGPTIIVLHDDENTASEAALLYIQENGGRLVELQHGGERNITFGLGGQQYTFDPNRMFTREGAAASLRNLGPYSDSALGVVRGLAGAFLNRAQVDSQNVVITAHNNTNDNYSTLSYDEGGTYEQDALFMYLGMPAEPDDFYFVTDRWLYDQLRAEEVNVVLQDNAQVTDDGSLSVYAARLGVPYVNVEAQHGHFERQSLMLERLFRILAEMER